MAYIIDRFSSLKLTSPNQEDLCLVRRPKTSLFVVWHFLWISGSGCCPIPLGVAGAEIWAGWPCARTEE